MTNSNPRRKYATGAADHNPPINLTDCELAGADVIIRPEVGNLHWSDFSHAGNLIAEGEKAATKSMPGIRKAIPLFRKLFDKRKNRV